MSLQGPLCGALYVILRERLGARPSRPQEEKKDHSMNLRFTVTLNKTKETKNTVRYDSQEEEPIIRTLYVNKAAFVDDEGEEIEAPEEIDVTVDDDVADDEEVEEESEIEEEEDEEDVA